MTEAMLQLYGDRLWRLKYCAADGSTRWVYLLIMLEFQSSVDADMALRIHAYAGHLLLQVSRERERGMGTSAGRGSRFRRFCR